MDRQESIRLKDATTAMQSDEYSLFESSIRGESRLLLALLESAIRDYWNGDSLQKSKALSWLRSTDKDIFSFAGICEFFELNPKDTLHLIFTGYFQDIAWPIV